MPVFDYQGAKSAGYNDDEIAQFLQQQKTAGVDMYIPKDQYEAIPQKKKGFIRNVAEGIVRNFAQGALTAERAAKGVPTLLAAGASAVIGDKQGAKNILRSYNKEAASSTNIPFAGEIKPYQTIGYKDGRVDWGASGKELLRTVGGGAEMGATLAGGTGIPGIIRAGGKGLIMRTLVQGAKEGAYTGAAYGFGGAAQEEGATASSVAKGTAIGGVGGAVVGGTLGAASAGRVVVGGKLKEGARENVTKALGATTKKTRAQAKKVVDEIIDRNIIATEGQLKDRAAAGVAKAGQAIEDLGELTGRTHVNSVLGPLQNSLADLRIPGTKKILPSQQYQVAVVDKIKADIMAAADGNGFISNEALRAIRRVYDKEVAKAGGFLGEAVKPLAEGSLIRYKRDTANTIRGILMKSEPDLAKLNKEFSFWKGVDELLAQKATKNPATTSLGQKIFQGAATAGSMASGAPHHALAWNLTIGMVQKAANSSYWKLLGANAKKRIGNALLVGSESATKKAITKEFGRIGTPEAKTAAQEIVGTGSSVVSNRPGDIILKTPSNIVPKATSATPVVTQKAKSVIPKTLSANRLRVINADGFEKLSKEAKKAIIAFDEKIVKERGSGDIGATITTEQMLSMPKLNTSIAYEVAEYLRRNASTISTPR